MTDIQALIEEARGYIHPDSAHALYLIGALADALEAEVALREALRTKVNTLADIIAGEHFAQSLRALIVQEDQEEHGDE